MANQFDLAYIHMMDGLGFGYHDKCKAMELKDVRHLISGVLFGNVGYTPEVAAEVHRVPRVPSRSTTTLFPLILNRLCLCRRLRQAMPTQFLSDGLSLPTLTMHRELQTGGL